MNLRSACHWLPLLALTLGSCRENPELVRKREEQRSEIKRLEGEIALIQEKMKDFPASLDTDVANARKTLDSQSAEIARLEQEIPALEDRKRALEKEFASYRAKYRVKTD